MRTQRPHKQLSVQLERYLSYSVRSRLHILMIWMRMRARARAALYTPAQRMCMRVRARAPARCGDGGFLNCGYAKPLGFRSEFGS